MTISDELAADIYAAAKAMTLHLADRGYHKIAFISLPARQNDRVQERRRGYVAALKKLGRRAEPSLMVEAAGGFASGGKALAQLLAGQPDIDAVFCTGDAFAIGALFECQRRGWRVPGRVAIAGFDDSELATQVVPTLTTLMIPRAEIGRTAARILLDALEGRSTGPRGPRSAPPTSRCGRPDRRGGGSRTPPLPGESG